jgi:hypothetical protein
MDKLKMPKPAVDYRPLDGKSNSKVFRRYAGLWDRYFARGVLGQFYLLWVLGLFAFNLGILTQGVQLNFYRALIPTSIEAGVVVLSLVALAYMNTLTDRDRVTIIRNPSKITLRRLTEATQTQANVSNDLSLFTFAFFFCILELTLMITRATSVHVIPAVAAPLDVVHHHDGDVNNFLLPMVPLPNTAVGLDYIFHVLVAVKCIFVLGMYFYRQPIDALKVKLAKIDRIHDNKDKEDLEGTSIELGNAARSTTQTYISH